MSPRAKVQAGGILRKSLDNTWQTPEKILKPVRSYFGGRIPFDPATAKDNPADAERFCSGPSGTMFAGVEGENGLNVSWDWPTFVNPPYGKELRDWLLKIEKETARGTTILALVPTSRWEMDYFHRFLAASTVVCFVRGRVAFVSSIDGAEVSGNSSGSMIVGFNVNLAAFVEAFAELGLCMTWKVLEVLRDLRGLTPGNKWGAR